MFQLSMAVPIPIICNLQPAEEARALYTPSPKMGYLLPFTVCKKFFTLKISIPPLGPLAMLPRE